MNTSISVPVGVRAARLAFASCIAVALTPVPAYAAGADILLPKPAEFIPALIAFLLIWLILAKLAWPSIIKVLDEREAKITGDLEAAEQAKLEARAKADAYDAKIAEANREAADIVAQARREAENERAAVISKANSDAAALIAKAHDTIEHDRHKAAAELSCQVVDLSADIAAKVIGDELTDEQQRRLATVRRVLTAASTEGGNR